MEDTRPEPTRLEPTRLGLVDLELLADLVSDAGNGAWLDPATGRTYPDFDAEVLGDDDEPVEDPDALGWWWIEGDEPGAAYTDMEDFAAAVAEPADAASLSAALGGRGSFRRFRDAVHSSARRLGPHWSRFASIRQQARLAQQVARCGLADDATLERALLELLAREDAVRAEIGPGVDQSQTSRRPRLLLLDGLPGVGKSVLARAWAEARPGVLGLDPDQLRAMIGGDPAEQAEPARVLALAMAQAHLQTGHDVVLAQLVAREDQLERFAQAARDGGGDLTVVCLVDDSAAAARRAAERAGSQLSAYRDGLEVIGSLPGVRGLELSGRLEADLESLTALVATPAVAGGTLP